jgi:MFS family permease
MITIYSLISSISTLLLPIAFNYFPLLLAIRLFQGFAVAISYIAMGFCPFIPHFLIPFLGAITAEWAPLNESGLFICIISCHFQFGPLFINPLAGEFCEFGWQWTFYISGTISLTFCLLFFLLFRDTPQKHLLPNIPK